MTNNRDRITGQTEKKKPRRGRPAKWTDEQRAEAVRIAHAEGIPAAVKAMGMPRSTVSDALRAAGVDLEAPARHRTQVARAAKAAAVAEARRSIVEHLAEQLDEVARGVLSRVELHRRLSEAVATVAADQLEDEATIAGMKAVARDEVLKDLLRRAELAEGALRTSDLARIQSALVGDRRLAVEDTPGTGDGATYFVQWEGMVRPPLPPGTTRAAYSGIVPIYAGTRVVDAQGAPVVDDEGRQVKAPDLPDVDDRGEPILDAEVVEDTEGEDGAP